MCILLNGCRYVICWETVPEGSFHMLITNAVNNYDLNLGVFARPK